MRRERAAGNSKTKNAQPRSAVVGNAGNVSPSARAVCLSLEQPGGTHCVQAWRGALEASVFFKGHTPASSQSSSRTVEWDERKVEPERQAKAFADEMWQRSDFRRSEAVAGQPQAVYEPRGPSR
jgi:hypothetical protein